MTQSLRAFAPLRCVHHGLLGHDAVVTQDATVLFVDLAGFTPLTDRLGTFGSRGTEQLSEVIQDFFGTVTAAAVDLGGDPVAYGGDALTIVFDGARRPTVEAAEQLAGSVQRLVTQTAGRQTLAGPLALQTRIGIAHGPVSTTVAHGAERAMPVQLGAGLDRAVAAESAAENGHVVLHESARSAVGAAGGAGSTAALMDPPTTAELTRLVHPVIRGRLTAGRAMLDSHRVVTVAFVGFPPVPADGVPEFRRTAARLVALVIENGGEVVQISGGDKGVVAMAVFGAPVRHDDDPLRAAHTVLELRRRTRAVKVGVTTGAVFATILGSPRRRFQGHFGQPVNIAARLMQAARPGQVLVDAATWQATSAQLRQRGLPELRTVKGRAEPVEVHKVAGWRRRRVLAPPGLTTPLVGRERELAIVEQLLDDLRRGRGWARTLRGDPGVGKSRIARECAQRAAVRGFEVVTTDADDHPYRSAGGLWRDLLAPRLGVAPTATDASWLTVLASELPDRAGQLHLLGPLLGLRLPHQGNRAALPPEIAAQAAVDLVAEVLVTKRRDRPLLLVLENVHHLDSSAHTAVARLADGLTASTVALLVTGRTATGATEAAGGGAGGWPLEELDPTAAAVLVEDVWRAADGGAPPAWLTDRAREQAGGNPLFLRAATLNLGRCWSPGDPPPAEQVTEDSLGDLLAERVDELEPLPRQLLTVLAVARRPCRPATAAGLLPELPAPAATAAALERLEAANFVRPVAGRAEARYRIRHSLLRQLVYDQMSHAERDRIHRGLVATLTRSAGDPREIAEHVRVVADPALGREWFPRAAAEARRAWNLTEAVEWWQLALPLLSGEPYDEAAVELLEVLLVGGHANDALALADETARRTTRNVGTQPTPGSLALRRGIAMAEAALVCGEYERCERKCRHAMREAVDENDHQRAAELLVRSLCERGQLSEAVEIGRTQLARATSSGGPGSLATAAASLGAALYLSGDPVAAASTYERARTAAAQAGDTVHEIHVLSDLAGCALAMDDNARCLELLTEARRLADRIGYRRHLAVSLNNEAQLRATLGDPYAAACAAVALRRFMSMGDLASAADVSHTWVTADARLVNEPTHWRRLASTDARLARPREAAEGESYLALTHARQGDADLALAAADRAGASPAALDDATIRRRGELARLIAAAGAVPPGKGDERGTLVASLEDLSAEPDASEVERAEICLEAWRLAPSAKTRAAAVAHLHEAFAVEPSAVVRSWFDDLGEELPPLPEPLPPPVGIGRTDTTVADLQAALSQLEEAVRARQSG